MKDLKLWMTSRLVHKIGLTIFLGMVVIFILDTYYFLSSNISDIRGDIRFFNANQVKNLQVFNYFRMSSELETFSRYTSIDYVEFFDLYGLRIAFAGKQIQELKDRLYSKDHPNWRIEVTGNDLFVVISYPIQGGRVGHLGHLAVYLSIKKQIKDVLWHISVYLLVLTIIFFWCVRVVGKAAGRVSEPIVELSTVFSNIRISTDFPQISAKLNIREFKILFRSYYDMVERLRAAEKEISRTAELRAMTKTVQMISHDLKKPFTFIKSTLNVFAELHHNPENLFRAKTDIQKSIFHIDNMLDDIMNYSRDMCLSPKPESMAEILSYCISEIAKTNKNKNIEFIHCWKNRKHPLVDGSRISRVFSNIIANAVEAIAMIKGNHRGIIYMETYDYRINDRDVVGVLIANNGPPIGERDLPHIFESFFTMGKSKGTGLGLASAKKIVDLHEGTLSVSNITPATKLRVESLNEWLNTGVLFTVTVPASDECEQPDNDTPPGNINKCDFDDMEEKQAGQSNLFQRLPDIGGIYTILLLEDEFIYRELIKNTLNAIQNPGDTLHIFETRTVTSALEILGKEKITHAIVDIELGTVASGFDFISRAKNRYKNRRVSFMIHSNRHTEDDKKRARELGVWNLVKKPLNSEDLISFLSQTEITDTESAVRETGGREVDSGHLNNTDRSAVTILLIDDEPVLLKNHSIFIQSYLSKRGKQVFIITAESGQEALDIVSNGPSGIDIIISDMNITFINEGLAIAEEIHDMSLNIPFYLLSNADIELMKDFVPSHHVKKIFGLPLCETILDEMFGLSPLVSLVETESGDSMESNTGKCSGSPFSDPPLDAVDETSNRHVDLTKIAVYAGKETAHHMGSIVRHVITPLRLLSHSVIRSKMENGESDDLATVEIPLVLYKQASILECLSDQFCLPFTERTRFTSGSFRLFHAVEKLVGGLSKNLGKSVEGIRFVNGIDKNLTLVRGKEDLLEKAILKILLPPIDQFLDTRQNGTIEFTTSENSERIRLLVSYNCITIADEDFLNNLLGSLPILDRRYDIEYATCAWYLQLQDAEISAKVDNKRHSTTFLLNLPKHTGC